MKNKPTRRTSKQQAQPTLIAISGAFSTLAERVYEQMKRDIVTHRLQPGQRVSEKHLATGYETSKAPVREALARLQQERLVVQISAKTQIIAPLTLKGVRDVFSLRNLLEPEAARLAAGHVDAARLRELNKACERPIKIGDANTEFQLLSNNRDFHLEIARASGNEILADWIGRLHDLGTRIMWLALKSPSTPYDWSAGHDELINALSANDGEKAKGILLRHIREGQHQVFERLMALPNVAGAHLDASVAEKAG